MRELLLIFNIKAHSFLKTVFEFKLQTIVKNISSLMIFGGFAVGVFFLSRVATAYLLQQANIGQFLFHRFLSMLLYVFFITVNLGNMIVSYSTLYKSQEVNFLMAMPISHQKIFLIKFVDNFFYSSSTLSIVGFAVLLGYGSFFNFPWHYYFFIMFFVLLPFMLIAGATAVVILMSLIKIASRIGVRWLLAIIISIYLSAIVLYFRITNPMQLVSEVMKHYPDINQYFGYLDPPFVRYLPNHWVTEFFYWLINGDPAKAISYFFLLFFTMVASLILAWLVARRLYYSSWVAATDARTLDGARGSPIRLKFTEFGTPTFLRPQTEVLLKRDFLLFFREPSQWLHLMLMAILLLIFLISMSTMELKLTQPFLQTVSFMVVFLFNGFLIASVALRFVFPSVSLESDSFWCVRASPLSLKKLYWHKVLVSFALVFVVAETLSILSVLMLRNDALLVTVSAACMGCVTLSMTGLNMGAGTYFAAYKEKNPIRIASSQGASLTFLASMVYLALVVSSLVVPLNKYFDSLIIRGVTYSSWSYMPMLFIGVVSLFLFSVSTRIGLKSIKRDF
jgi:ABC-2 type transport system permease protein